MNWTFKEPALGDMLRVKLGAIYHYGIFVSEDEIVQFGLPPTTRPTVKDCDVEICISDIDAFACGNFPEVAELDRKESKNRRKPKDTVAYAKSRLGEKGYDILYNNCEHFVYECVFGKKFCSQTEGIREMFQALPILDVFVAEIPQNTKLGSVHPKARHKAIKACGSEKAQREKYYVWKLLEYAIERTFETKFKKVKFEESGNGKWRCDACWFSLSHSKNAVAVALSKKPVGVDIEFYNPDRMNGFAPKILNEKEKAEFENVPEAEQNEFLLKKWTQKESIYKCLDVPSCSATSMDTTATKTFTSTVEVGSEKFVLSVASDCGRLPRYYEHIDLTKIK